MTSENKVLDFWHLLKFPNDFDFAQLYYKLNPSKYIHSQEDKTSTWYEYNEYNVLICYGSTEPPSLLNNIAERLRKYMIEQRNALLPPLQENYTSSDLFKTASDTYKTNRNLCDKAYQNIGNYYKGKGCIQYLKQLYTVPNIASKFDNNQKILAFDNMCFDFEILKYRKIEPDDYITKTTKLHYNDIRNEESQKTITKLLFDIFDKQELVDYYLTITGLSLFTNKFETMHCLTGVGANGKGLLSTMVSKALGDYFIQAENTFLTQKKRDDKNPTLAKSQGVRYLLITEPQENEMEQCELNIDFVKSITGRDRITCRDMYKSTVSYIPFFTPFMQCNEKPTLNKLDNAVLRRLKVLNHPNIFTSNPDEDNVNEKKIDTDLKDQINDELALNFLFMLIDMAIKHKDDKTLIMPIDCINETKNYIDENNKLKGWIDLNLLKMDEKKIPTHERIICKTAKDLYNSDKDIKDQIKNTSKFIKQLQYNNIKIVKSHGIETIIGYIINKNNENEYEESKTQFKKYKSKKDEYDDFDNGLDAEY